MNTSDPIDRLRAAIQIDRLVETAVRLIEVPSPTRSAAAVADRLAEMLREDGFSVERPEAGWPEAPAVVGRWDTGRKGRTLQFNGHLDTVHLPFVPPRVENGKLYGSGASDMKGGIAAMFEAARALRESDALPGGSILLTAHDLHEAPWGVGEPVYKLIDEGYAGDGVLLPEYLCDRLPVIGRGQAVMEVTIRREGEPVHEVLGGMEQPSVIYAGADLVKRFEALDHVLSSQTHPLAGRASMFVGQNVSGEIYNQAPMECKIAGSRRWLPGNTPADVEREYREILAEVAAATGTQIDGQFKVTRDAFEINPETALVLAFQTSCRAVMGQPLPAGAKPFVDDGNIFVSHGGIPAITHGPDAKGAHTVDEEVPVAELERVALVYGLTAIQFCGGSG
jgi:acetylornithine deacetylase/succinyl-diaminopimelate desuccinylase-like protein